MALAGSLMDVVGSFAPGGVTPSEAMAQLVQQVAQPKKKAKPKAGGTSKPRPGGVKPRKAQTGATKYKDPTARGTGWSYVNPQGRVAQNVQAPLAHERLAVWQGAGQPFARRNPTLGEVASPIQPIGLAPVPVSPMRAGLMGMYADPNNPGVLYRDRAAYEAAMTPGRDLPNPLGWLYDWTRQSAGQSGLA